jgi:prepilin-type N-terminal cleavage/methylation domain-containing protein/prepilin-type processing-associated H-X9-DG protein
MARIDRRHRAGFTLVELLVVIAIIGTLVALLLPAVNAARETARRMQCSNNLHNLGIAIINYHDSLRSYPNSHFHKVEADDAVCQGVPGNCEQWSWCVLIFPYIEQQNLHSQLGVMEYSLHHVLAKANPGQQDPRPLLRTKLSLFICPSDSNPLGDLGATERDFRDGLGTVMGGWGNFQGGVNNYMCNRGTDRRVRPSQDTHGIFMESHSKKMQDITDGTSNTFMLGERDTQICKSGTWIGVRNPGGTGSRGIFNSAAVVSVRLNSPDPPIPWNDTANGCYQGFSSLHPGGANFALCDGSVRFVSQNIQYKPPTGPGRSGATRNTFDAHTPRNPEWEPVYSVYSRLGRRNDGFPTGDY